MHMFSRSPQLWTARVGRSASHQAAEGLVQFAAAVDSTTQSTASQATLPISHLLPSSMPVPARMSTHVPVAFPARSPDFNAGTAEPPCEEWEANPLSDAQLLSDACVSLAACTVAYALQSMLGKLAPGTDGAVQPAAFSTSVCMILLDELRSSVPLDRARSVRLCNLLGVPQHVGHDWLNRCDELRMCLTASAEQADNRAGNASGWNCSNTGSSEETAWPALPRAAAQTKHTFAQLEATSQSSSPAAQCFGRQTVWCATVMLQRVFREAAWPADGNDPSSSEAELAATVVQMLTQGQQYICPPNLANVWQCQ